MWFHLSWTEVVDNVTTSVCCEQLSLKTQPVLSIMYTNLWTSLILVQKATISCFKIDLCIRNFNWYYIDWLIWFHLSWTEVVDNVTTSVCCEQLSLKTQLVLSIMYKNFKFVLCLFRKNTITWFKIYSCIKNFHRYKIDWFLRFHLSWTEVVDNVTTSVCCEQLSFKTQPVLSIIYKNLWTCLLLVPKATISCYKIDLCIRNFSCLKIDWLMWFHLSWTELVDSVTTLLTGVNSCRWKLNRFCPSCTKNLWTCLILG